MELLIQKEEYEMEKLEEHHQNNINAFNNKYKHLEYDHEIFKTKTLVDNSEKAVREEDAIKQERELKYLDRKQNLKTKIKEEAHFYSDDIEKAKERLDRKFKAMEHELEEKLKKIKENYVIKMKNLELDLELRLKVDIHELEERKNLHINNLMKAFEDRMNKWKKENIDEIKEKIELIKTNTVND